MTMPERPQNEEIWDKLSQDALAVVLWLGPLTATSADREFLEHMAEEPVDELSGQKVNLDRALNELQQFGVLERVTYIDELRETVERNKPTRDINDYLMVRELTEGEREYLRALHSIEHYERDPKASKVWAEPRLRLQAGFKGYAAKQWEDKLGFNFEDRK